MTKEELTKLGWKIRDEFIDKFTNSHILIVELPETSMLIMYFYTDQNGIPMVEIFHEKSLSNYYYDLLYNDRKNFMKEFKEIRIYTKPDWYSREDVWVNEQKDFIARIKSIYNSI